MKNATISLWARSEGLPLALRIARVVGAIYLIGMVLVIPIGSVALAASPTGDLDGFLGPVSQVLWPLGGILLPVLGTTWVVSYGLLTIIGAVPVTFLVMAVATACAAGLQVVAGYFIVWLITKSVLSRS